MDLNEYLHAAVIVLYENSSDSLILTQRSEHLRAHPGEICFPGGLWEEEDRDFYSTALRELYEELGITADRVALIKELNIEKTLLGRIIHPWLVSIESIHPYSLNSSEVSRLVAVPMSLVQTAENYKEVVIERVGHRVKSCEFVFKEEWIWGATARIMRQLVL